MFYCRFAYGTYWDMGDSGKFLIIQRIDKNATMATVSPFVLSNSIIKAIGETRELRKLRNGSVLVRTKNQKQAKLLMKMNELTKGINIKVIENVKLNQSKGVVSCFDLKHANDAEILEELKTQGVIDLTRLKKRVGKDLINSDSILFTFKTTSPPEYLKIGYLRVRVRLYIPQPMRCYNCNKFGHSAKECKVEQICRNCIELKTTNHECKQIVCSNCYSIEHAAWEKICPKYKEEWDIQTIKTRQKIPYAEARKIYLINRPPMVESLGEIVKENLIVNQLVPIKLRKKDDKEAKNGRAPAKLNNEV